VRSRRVEGHSILVCVLLLQVGGRVWAAVILVQLLRQQQCVGIQGELALNVTVEDGLKHLHPALHVACDTRTATTQDDTAR
jgi:hypothetical protein